MYQKFTIAVVTTLVLSTSGLAQSSLLKTIHFKKNSFVIENKYLPALDDLGQRCVSDSFSFLKIFAYADTVGSKKYNELLSQNRALEVYGYLTKKFCIDTGKIYITWLGEEIDGSYDLHFPNANVQQRRVDMLVSFSRNANE